MSAPARPAGQAGFEQLIEQIGRIDVNLQHRCHYLLRRHLRRLGLPCAGVVDHRAQFGRHLPHPIGEKVDAFVRGKVALNAAGAQGFQLGHRRIFAAIGDDDGNAALEKRFGERQPDAPRAAGNQHRGRVGVFH